VIEITGLVKRYGATPALDGFTARVEPGEAFGLVGPNGAGKSTLIRILATLVRPDGGRAVVLGRDVVAESRAVRAVTGYLADVPGVYQDMRVGEFLEFFAEAFHLRGAARRAAVGGALERAGLTDRRADFVETLSLGLRQRLLLARTLLHGPRVLLLDEPATGLDPLARVELRARLRALCRDGLTLLLSSHILSDLEDICDRVALIDAGRNAADPDGRTIVTLGAREGGVSTCEVEVLGDAEAAGATAASRPGARVVGRDGGRLLVEVTGGAAGAAALLEHLVRAGVAVTRFDPRRAPLEAQYRRTFGPGGGPRT
jgi:ABC-2 type transport system ATP-binding protein